MPNDPNWSPYLARQAFLQKVMDENGQGGRIDVASLGDDKYSAIEPEPPTQNDGALHFTGDWIRMPDGSVKLMKKNQYR